MTRQAATIARLNALSTPAWTVDAGPLPTYATEACSADYAHGSGTCYLDHDGDALCAACTEEYLHLWLLVSGAHISIDVLRS